MSFSLQMQVLNVILKMALLSNIIILFDHEFYWCELQYSKKQMYLKNRAINFCFSELLNVLIILF